MYTSVCTKGGAAGGMVSDLDKKFEQGAILDESAGLELELMLVCSPSRTAKK